MGTMKRSKFQNLIDNAPDIPTLPAVATKVIEVVRDADSTAEDLRQIICHDPVLSSRLMRMANSAYFGLPDELTDLQRAIVLLGFNSVRNLAFTACLQSLYKSEYRCGSFTASSLWMHSVSVAVISRMLAERIWPEFAEEAFLAGIVHDVGIIVEWNLLPERFEQVIRAFEGTGRPFGEAEKQALGFDHRDCGSAILRRWGLPKHLVRVARQHHGSRKEPASLNSESGALGDRLAALVHLAECICAERGNGFIDEPRDEERVMAVLGQIGCGHEEYRNIVDCTDEELDRARTILAL